MRHATSQCPSAASATVIREAVQQLPCGIRTMIQRRQCLDPPAMAAEGTHSLLHKADEPDLRYPPGPRHTLTPPLATYLR